MKRLIVILTPKILDELCRTGRGLDLKSYKYGSWDNYSWSKSEKFPKDARLIEIFLEKKNDYRVCNSVPGPSVVLIYEHDSFPESCEGSYLPILKPFILSDK